MVVSHGEKSHRVKTGGNGEGTVVRERVVRERLCCVRQELKEKERKKESSRQRESKCKGPEVRTCRAS